MSGGGVNTAAGVGSSWELIRYPSGIGGDTDPEVTQRGREAGGGGVGLR